MGLSDSKTRMTPTGVEQAANSPENPTFLVSGGNAGGNKTSIFDELAMHFHRLNAQAQFDLLAIAKSWAGNGSPAKASGPPSDASDALNADRTS
jgi:hypothetical protein